MRPSEIDFTSRAQPYFDTSNGEVILGTKSLHVYAQNIPDPTTITELGALLYTNPNTLDTDQYPPLDTASWDRTSFVDYGKWLLRTTKPFNEDSPRKKDLGRPVIEQAWRVGVGPSLKKIVTEFGGLSTMYQEIRAENVKLYGAFDDWTIDDYVTYLAKLGNNNPRKPTFKDLERYAEKDPRNPSPRHMYKKFQDIGGTRKLLELAGFTVPEMWEDQDFMDWGVRFMTANNGMLPGDKPLQFLSHKQLGPSKRPIVRIFGSIGEYHRRVIPQYYDHVNEQRELETEKLETIKTMLAANELPFSLFSSDYRQSTEPPSSFQEVSKCLTTQEIIPRYARYVVAQALRPHMSKDKRISIAKNQRDRGFVAALHQNDTSLRHGDIEHEALVLGVFDDIWPTTALNSRLKLGEEYEVYCELLRNKRREKLTQVS